MGIIIVGVGVRKKGGLWLGAPDHHLTLLAHG